MAGLIDIFKPSQSAIANGLEGKIILIYGGNNLGKTAQAVRFPKPFVMACEAGLNGIDGVPYLPVNNWATFKTIVSQFTGMTRDKAREMYSTIIIDEVYASSIYAQDFVCQNYGNGALTLADGDSKHNLYQLYEKEYFRQINLLVNAGFTVVFIAHEQVNSKTGFITPKGDKRCIDPIIDKCDYVVYLHSNGVDANGNVIKSSGYLAETNQFFARARIEYTPTFIQEFTAENLSAAIQTGIDKKRELENAQIVSFEEQQKRNETLEFNFDELMAEFNSLIASIPGSDKPETTEEGLKFRTFWYPQIVQITDRNLGVGVKVSQCSRNQSEAIYLINNEIKALIEANK